MPNINIPLPTPHNYWNFECFLRLCKCVSAEKKQTLKNFINVNIVKNIEI